MGASPVLCVGETLPFIPGHVVPDEVHGNDPHTGRLHHAVRSPAVIHQRQVLTYSRQRFAGQILDCERGRRGLLPAQYRSQEPIAQTLIAVVPEAQRLDHASTLPAPSARPSACGHRVAAKSAGEGTSPLRFMLRADGIMAGCLTQSDFSRRPTESSLQNYLPQTSHSSHQGSRFGRRRTSPPKGNEKTSRALWSSTPGVHALRWAYWTRPADSWEGSR
jgi:hypothetical protein